MSSDVPSFAVGFVLAGAISAGCYSAGVMDFVIEALDDYHARRHDEDWDGPRHDVHVPVLAGASAGGMVAGMAGLHMFRGLRSVRPGEAVPDRSENRLYSSWVRDISIERLLETTDLGEDAKGVRSALCSDVLDEILADAFDVAGPVQPRTWVGQRGDPRLNVLLTLTNIRGVPYSFPLRGSAAIDAFGMLNHADVGAFAFGARCQGATAPYLDVEGTDTPAWRFFKDAALATGAFPIGLVPRSIERPAVDYFEGGVVGTTDPTGRFVPICPDKSFPRDGRFKFWAVDGGMIDNEPLALARRYLDEGRPTDGSPNGESAQAAMILVAPFPNARHVADEDVDGTLRTVLPGMLSALRNQARFKPSELASARDPSDFSRFLVSPERTRDDGTTPEHAIASGALGGFSGFLHESFRRHDYLLGRRNAQAFLRWNFGLPTTHTLFQGQDFGPRWLVRDAGSKSGTVRPEEAEALEPKLFAMRKGDDGTSFGYPIIPLTKRMLKPIELTPADLPRPSVDMLEPLRPAIHTRIERLVEVLVDKDLQSDGHGFGKANWLVRQGAKLFGTDALNRKVTGAIEDTLGSLSRSFP